MRVVDVHELEHAVEKGVLEANTRLPEDVIKALKEALEKETSPRGRRFLQIILENADIAAREGLALCQDTGLVVIDLKLGQEVALTGGDLQEAVDRGVRRGYARGYFRKSMVKDPFNRVNTQDNTPALLHTTIVPGDRVQLTVMPKGGGSENMGRLAMLKPAQGISGVKDFVIATVKEAGGNPCPPVIVGVGVGGNMETAAWLAKRALVRPLGQGHPDLYLAGVEKELKERINQLGIGPQGLGGDTTALAVNIEVCATHIASLPVAVTLGCHSTRRVTLDL